MICFDLEGPLSPQDNAYEVMKLAKNGGQVFEALSEFDDILALKGRPGYEPGDTLKLIVPFLVYYGITESDIRAVSGRAGLVQGMKETIDWLREKDVPVRIITTSYQQHAHSIGKRLGVPQMDITSTRLSLDEIKIGEGVIESIEEVEKNILSEGLTEDCIGALEKLYFTSGLFDSIGVEIVGGQRKVDAMIKFVRAAGLDMADVVAVGDSITDYKMLREIRKGGGLAVAFNANKYCLPYADIAIATVDGRALIPVIEGFLNHGKKGAIEKVERLKIDPGRLDDALGGHLQLTPSPHFSTPGRGDSATEVLKVHKSMRMKVRGEAGKLG